MELGNNDFNSAVGEDLSGRQTMGSPRSTNFNYAAYQNTSNRLTLMSVLPSINTTASLFWSILTENPFGVFSRVLMMLFLEIVLMALFSRLSLINDENGSASVIDDKSIYENGLKIDGSNAN